ncbi:hypothetical protein GR11A_00238 [Vibrio phage vB_VcorM_GR11A]|nr:hypothetical protein GR11A_00238 [Vibrio phage vB_VcorM_GR11A]
MTKQQTTGPKLPNSPIACAFITYIESTNQVDYVYSLLEGRDRLPTRAIRKLTDTRYTELVEGKFDFVYPITKRSKCIPIPEGLVKRITEEVCIKDYLCMTLHQIMYLYTEVTNHINTDEELRKEYGGEISRGSIVIDVDAMGFSIESKRDLDTTDLHCINGILKGLHYFLGKRKVREAEYAEFKRLQAIFEPEVIQNV